MATAQPACHNTPGSRDVDLAATSWYVIQTKPRAEERVAQLLDRKRIESFLPRLFVRHRHGSRRWSSLEPLFPGYLFVRFGGRGAIGQVRWTPGVRRLLGAEEEGAPTPVSEEIVTMLRARTQERGYIVAPTRLVPGTQVRFRSGPMALLEGIIDRPTSRADRVRVLLQLVHGSITVEVGIDEVELVEAS